jgi:hypothetical protein
MFFENLSFFRRISKNLTSAGKNKPFPYHTLLQKNKRLSLKWDQPISGTDTIET